MVGICGRDHAACQGAAQNTCLLSSDKCPVTILFTSDVENTRSKVHQLIHLSPDRPCDGRDSANLESDQRKRRANATARRSPIFRPHQISANLALPRTKLRARSFAFRDSLPVGEMLSRCQNETGLRLFASCRVDKTGNACRRAGPQPWRKRQVSPFGHELPFMQNCRE